MEAPSLKEKAGALPRQPGVYLWKSDPGSVLYVGKAQDLRARTLQYFGPQSDERKAEMMRLARDVEFIVVGNVKEALVLEQTLIKQHRPPYNVMLADDKRYPYIAVTRDEWPRVIYTRDLDRPGTFFGPFPDAGKAKRVARMLNKTFRLRQCRVLPNRECLYYHLDQCTAPCIRAVTSQEYGEQANQAVRFLKGQGHELVTRARSEMEEAAQSLRFERAAELRDLVGAVESVLERQHMESTRGESLDAIGLAVRGPRACALLLLVRDGKVLGREPYFLNHIEGTPAPGVVAAFVEQYYVQAPSVPARILVPVPLPDASLLEQVLAERRGGRVQILTPERGERRAYVETAETNARLLLEQEFALRERKGSGAVEALQKILGLSEPPSMIEGFDASHHAGQHTVASMVVFVEGRPRKSDYRKFRIRTTAGGDDPGALREAVGRRYTRVLAEEGADQLPDLILIDGGRVQLKAALDALGGLGLEDLPILGLAKRFEEVYRPKQIHPLRLDPADPALQLLQQVRDEAHRFAIGYQGLLKRKDFIRSALDDIPGVGPERRRRLLATFGSVEALRESDVEAIARVPGIPKPLAQRIHDALVRTENDRAGKP